MQSMSCGGQKDSMGKRFSEGCEPVSGTPKPGAAGYDIEAESYSLAITETSAILSFVGTNGERASVTMPAIMLATLGQQITAVRPRLARRWSPKGQDGQQ